MTRAWRLLAIPLALFILSSAPVPAFAALVNINTADSPTLETLTGIGPSKAAAIILYRTTNGPFAKIEDIQNVSGIGPATYAGIQAFITVGDAPSTPPPDTTPSATTTSTAAETTIEKTASVLEPTPLTVYAGPDQTTFVHVPLRLAAQATKQGRLDAKARFSWSFGDGSLARGVRAEKIYTEPGSYLVMVDGYDGLSKGHDEVIVTVLVAQARIASIAGNGITVANDSSYRLDLSGWWIRTPDGSFRVPMQTVLLPNSKVTFSSEITKLIDPVGADLYYPDGTFYGSYAANTAALPGAAEGSSPIVQTSFSGDSSLTSTPVTSAHAVTQARAPAVAPQPAAVGAAWAATSTDTSAPPPASGGMFSSPWTFAGAIGALLLAGAAFIFS